MGTEEKITYLTEIYEHFKNTNGREILSDKKNIIRFVIAPFEDFVPTLHYVEVENNNEADEIINQFLKNNNIDDDVSYYVTYARKLKWPSDKGYLFLQALDVQIHHI